MVDGERNSTCSPASSGDPLLGTLTDNGGLAETMALLPGSPAIDIEFNATCEAADQRGMTRPMCVACDIGAYEKAIDLFLPLIVRWDCD